MVQNEIIQVDVAFLSYNIKRCADSPLVKQDSSCVVGLKELQKHRDFKRKEKAKMGQEAYHHYKWYNSMLCLELKSLSENAKLKIIHWHIESGNTDAFMMSGSLYKAVSIIIGNELEHWYCANTGPGGSHSYGSRPRKIEIQQQHELNTEKVANFTIDDDEAFLVAKPIKNNVARCTPQICANNCLDCKKFRSPFTKTHRNSDCACFPSRKDFKSIDDSDLDENSETEDQDIAYLPSAVFARRGRVNPQFKLNAIREESIIN